MKIQQKAALRYVGACRIVSMEAVYLQARIPPVQLIMEECEAGL